jgi:heterodisulfide reductase subunit B
MISTRIPFVEQAIRKVFEKMSVKYFENDKFSCCPEPNGIKNYNQYLFELTACRNLALAEMNDHDIITPCNGCFESLKSCKSEVSIDADLKSQINKDLSKIDLEFQGKTDVIHILEFLGRRIGVSAIKDMVTNPLHGLRVAVHYGCHFLRPSNKIQTDNPMEPQIFDELVEALGAKSIIYDDKMLCCGGSFERAGKKELGLQLMKHKMDKIKEARADAICVCCPQCFLQFDILQRELKKIDYEYDIPVFYYPELLAVALDIPLAELGLNKHTTDTTKIFDIIMKKKEANKEIQKNFDLDFLKTCYNCSACNDDCPPARFSTFNPRSFVERILEGKIQECIEDPEIWSCLDCYLCYELCPSKKGLVDVFTTLRNLATKTGAVTLGFKNEFTSFLKTGTVGQYSISQRKKMNLPIIEPKNADLIKLIKQIDQDKNYQKVRNRKSDEINEENGNQIKEESCEK